MKFSSPYDRRQSDTAQWSLVGDQLQFNFGDWDATLIGNVISAERIALHLKWKTTDEMPHSEKCQASKKY